MSWNALPRKAIASLARRVAGPRQARSEARSDEPRRIALAPRSAETRPWSACRQEHRNRAIRSHRPDDSRMSSRMREKINETNTGAACLRTGPQDTGIANIDRAVNPKLLRCKPVHRNTCRAEEAQMITNRTFTQTLLPVLLAAQVSKQVVLSRRGRDDESSELVWPTPAIERRTSGEHTMSRTVQAHG